MIKITIWQQYGNILISLVRVYILEFIKNACYKHYCTWSSVVTDIMAKRSHNPITGPVSSSELTILQRKWVKAHNHHCIWHWKLTQDQSPGALHVVWPPHSLIPPGSRSYNSCLSLLFPLSHKVGYDDINCCGTMAGFVSGSSTQENMDKNSDFTQSTWATPSSHLRD